MEWLDNLRLYACICVV